MRKTRNPRGTSGATTSTRSRRALTPPTWPLVPAALEEWVSSMNAVPGRIRAGDNLSELLAQAHDGFERVHPFIDGNGRTGRLVLNLVLVRLGYPPVVVLKEQRPAYLKAMQQADKGDYGPLGEILARAMIDILNRLIIPSVAGPAKLVALAALVDGELSLVALRAVAQRGRLDAYQRSDGQWLSSRKASRPTRSHATEGRAGPHLVDAGGV